MICPSCDNEVGEILERLTKRKSRWSKDPHKLSCPRNSNNHNGLTGKHIVTVMCPPDPKKLEELRMKKANIDVADYQRDWRNKIIKQLKDKLGNYCHKCSSADNWHMQIPAEFLELVIKQRKSEEFLKFGTNTISIYAKMLKGELPMDKLTLLCKECKFGIKKEEALEEER